ncbi:hypothetical protein AMS68_002559 [Peltaster fructicola]|uniref:Alpha/beta hydrolase fold-3 domain-containing protein n=1 Tax=Peltaster fructicola TaxID=286661 RepID=A0A6H0XQJ6_9PEZI|nr:hypothetical protein AMS68_002559 [Peltaster fructicola]
MAHITDWMALADPNPEWEAVGIEKMSHRSYTDEIQAVKQMGQRPNLGLFPDIATLRGYIIQSKKQMTATAQPVPGVKETNHQVSVRDGSTITVRVYSPEGKTGCPLVVIFHGGGFCIGGLENEELLCRRAAGVLGCVVVNVDYRLAPEHPFPTPVHDCYDATKWAAANASSIGADPSKGFIVGGTSAGGNLAVLTALQHRDDKLSPPITGCHLMIPTVCTSVAVPDKYKADFRSWDQNEHADILSRKACELFIGNYVPNSEDLKNPLVSPLVWKTGFSSFPNSYFQVCGADPLRDEALIFERLLRVDEKVKTKVDVYQGLPHGFWSIVPTLNVSKKFTDESLEGVRWLLEQYFREC